jgi:tRNA threonylcarbamoyladenosine biosynthesis protein TsaB
VLNGAREVIARGRNERLAPMARDVMAQAGLGFDRLERIAVTVGPRSPAFGSASPSPRA